MHRFARIGNTTYFFDLDSVGVSVSIASGGFGKIYSGSLEYAPPEAAGEILTKKVAFKRMKKKNTEYTNKAVEEYINMAYLNDIRDITSNNHYPPRNPHKHIVTLYASFISPSISKATIAMEMMDESASSYVRCRERKHTFNPSTYIDKGDFFRLQPDHRMECIKKIMQGFLGGLAYMHANNVVHADVKLSNLLITKATGGQIGYMVDKVKVSDLDSPFDVQDQGGFSALICTITTRAPELFVRYMAVDMDKDNIVSKGYDIVMSQKMDIYSCGVELFRLLYRVSALDESKGIDYDADYPVCVGNVEAFEVMYFDKLVRTYGNFFKDNGPDRWQVGIDVIKAFDRTDRRKLFTFINNDFSEWTLAHIKNKIFKNKISVDWCELVLDMIKINPDKRPSADVLLSKRVLGGNGTKTEIPINPERLSSFMSRFKETQLERANNVTTTFD